MAKPTKVDGVINELDPNMSKCSMCNEWKYKKEFFAIGHYPPWIPRTHPNVKIINLCIDCTHILDKAAKDKNKKRRDESS